MLLLIILYTYIMLQVSLAHFIAIMSKQKNWVKDQDE